jgi:hypothetical protein
MAAAIGRGVVWGNDEVLALIDIWRNEDIEGQLQGMHRNLPLYHRVTDLLAVRGYERTAEHCRSKMKSFFFFFFFFLLQQR